MGLFADDTAYWSTAKSAKSAITNLQQASKVFTKWCKTWKLKLNESKSQFIIFYPKGRGTREDEKEKYIKINNIKFKPTNTAKYLGGTLDQKVSFKSHIMGRKKTALTVHANLKSLFLSKIPIKLKIRLYSSILRAMITYGHD